MAREVSLKPLEDYEKEPEPEPTTEVNFLRSYEGCGKTFIDAGYLRNHSHIHGEKQFVCDHDGCGKKFLDRSKRKRHYLFFHTGERAHVHVCPIEGCGKAFSLNFNLRSHMKTHSRENYYVCKYPDCGKRYAHEYKLKNHIAAHHEKCVSRLIHEYKLKLHLKREHPGLGDENVADNAQANNNNADNEMDEASDADA